MHAVVVAGSRPADELDRTSLEAADLLVAVDGGADALARIGSVPSLLVGDLDSISGAALADLESRGVEVRALPTAKDETDLEVALGVAVDRGATEITVLNALGGPRLDHLVGNLLLLTAPWLAGVRVRLLGRLHEVFLVKGESTVAGRPGDIVSLLPLTSLVEAVHTEGLLYPLRGEPLLQGQTRGVSNEMTSGQARVTPRTGGPAPCPLPRKVIRR